MIRYKINGKYVTREEWDARPGAGLNLSTPCLGTVAYSESHPLVQDGAAYFRYQVDEARQEIRKRNIKGVLVRDNGQLEITSRRGRKELLRMRGLVDNDGGYGD